jgi:C_GCAxxG_C_C family probable redox protein
MDQPLQNAEDFFKEGFNCAQSVFAVVAPQYGIPRETAFKIASPFGGGIAHRGGICGAVTGALLALGLAHGAATPAEKEATYRLANEFMRRFEERHGSVTCRDLLGCDISTPEGSQAAKDRNVFAEICFPLVKDAAAILSEMLEETSR